MPSLKDLNCAIELSQSQQALREFGTIYGDGFVETFIPVLSEQQPFSIHLTSNRFIAPGVAIFVYVDGVYQCNRNRQDLKLRKLSDNRSLVDFRVRQKEERQKDGSMIAREWAFDKLNIASADDAPNLCSPNILDDIGCIEVVVLRCAGTRHAKSASTMNFDGAGDYPDRRFDWDDTSSSSNERSMYDDRGPFFTTSGNGHGPPPPLSSYRSPYAESLRSQKGSASGSRRTTHGPHELFPPASVTRHSRPHSRYSEPVSPGAQRTSDVPSSGFHYGSGPVPRDEKTYSNHTPDVKAAQLPAIDPIWLNKLLTTAVKQGVEESRRMDVQSEGQTRYKENALDTQTTSQPPGAWPESSLDAHTLLHQQSEQPAYSSRDHQSDHGSNWKQSQSGWGEGKARSRLETHVTWNNAPVEETASSSAGGWNLHEQTSSDSWDTGDTWPTDRVADWEASSQQGKHCVPDTPSHYNVKLSHPVTPRPHHRRRSKHDSQRISRSKSQPRHSRRKQDATSSSEENGSWFNLDRPSDSVVSLSSSDDTLQPSNSRSRVQTPQHRSKSRSRPSKSSLREHERKSSNHSHRTLIWGPVDVSPVSVPSGMTRLTPTVMNAPAPVVPVQVKSRQSSAYAAQPDSILPPPTWGAAVHETMRKPSNVSNVPSTILPAPYAPSLKDFVQSTRGEIRGGHRSSSSSSWGNDKKDGAVQLSWGKEIKDKAGWGENSGKDWQDKAVEEDDKRGWYSPDDDKTNGWTNNDNDQKAEDNRGWNPEDAGWGTMPILSNEKKDDKKDDFADLKSALKFAFENPSAPRVPWQDQSWTLPANNAPEPVIQQPTTTPLASIPAPSPLRPKQSHRMSNRTLANYRSSRPSCEPTQSPSRMSNKPLTQHRPNHPSLEATPKPHWQFPPPPSTSPPTHPLVPNSTSIAPAEPRLTISHKSSVAKGIEHHVRGGEATQYGHVVGRPEYLDGLDRPYAVFRFKYRSVGVLKGMFGEDVEEKEKEKEQVEELIGRLMELDRRLKNTSGEAGGKKDKEKGSDKDKQRRVSAQTDGVARNLTERWVERHSGEPSVIAKSLVKERRKRQDREKTKRQDKEKKEEEEVVGDWGQGVDDGWGGGDVKW